MSKLSSAPHLVKNDEVNVRVEMIQSLIPIALEAVADLLSHELDELAGPSYARKASSVRRWGRQGGSVYLGGQRIPISVSRARDTAANRELSIGRPRVFLDTPLTYSRSERRVHHEQDY